MLEKELVRSFISTLKDYEVYYEVGLTTNITDKRKFDIILRKNNVYIGIQAKMTASDKLLQQSIECLSFAHYIYALLPSNRVKQLFVSACAQHGIGVIDETGNVYVHPKLNVCSVKMVEANIQHSLISEEGGVKSPKLLVSYKSVANKILEELFELRDFEESVSLKEWQGALKRQKFRISQNTLKTLYLDKSKYSIREFKREILISRYY